MTNGRDKGIVEINGREYVVCPKGAFIDLDGNLCGFLCGDIVRECQLEEEESNLIDSLVSAETKRLGEGTKAALVEVVIGAAVVIVVGAIILPYLTGDMEADAAERQAEKMQKRLEEARKRHSGD